MTMRKCNSVMRQLDSPSQTTAHLCCLLQLHASPDSEALANNKVRYQLVATVAQLV